MLRMILILSCSLATLVPAIATAQEAAAADTVTFADAYSMDIPDAWVKKEPRSRIVEHEFAVPAVEGDKTDGRVTMMGAGGSVTANIDRWIGQFAQPDSSDTKQRAKVTRKDIDDMEVHVVDISGTYKDRPRGPFGPAVDQPGYRMLGAVIVTKDRGSYFVKLYGPANTVASGQKAFHTMLDSLHAVD